MRPAILFLLLFGLSALACAQVPPLAPLRAALLHADGIQPALQALRKGERLIEAACNGALAAECTAGQKDAANGKLLATLKLVTFYPDRDPAPTVPRTYAELQSTLRDISDDIDTKTLAYAYRLFVRFGATLSVCPPGKVDEYRTYLANMEKLAFQTYGSMTPAELERMRKSIDSEEAALTKTMRGDWSAEECNESGSLGVILLESLMNNLEPWNTDAPIPVGRDPKRAAASEFLLKAALELELRIRPDMKTDLRKLYPKPDAVPSR